MFQIYCYYHYHNHSIVTLPLFKQKTFNRLRSKSLTSEKVTETGQCFKTPVCVLSIVFSR